MPLTMTLTMAALRSSRSALVAFILIITSIVGGTGSVQALEDYHVPTFSVFELTSGARSDDLSYALRTSGLVSVDLGDSFRSSELVHDRDTAFAGICQCAGSSDSDVSASMLFQQVRGADSSSLLVEGGQTVRRTFATATVGDTPINLPVEELQAACGGETTSAMDSLRDHVAVASRSFVSALDRMRHESTNHSGDYHRTLPILESSSGKDYFSVASVVRSSTNLEHFHLYSDMDSNRDSIEENRAEEVVLSVHTDAGLFLAFVPGRSCDLSSSADSSDSNLFVHVNGELQRAVFSEGTVGVMLGVGAEHWLENMGSLELRAARHAVQMRPGSSRAWYGMMHTVPQNAIVQKSPERRTFGDMRKAMVVSGASRVFNADGRPEQEIAIGCGASQDNDFPAAPSNKSGEHEVAIRTARRRRRLQMVEDASVCNNATNFYCWMSCLDIPDQENADTRQENGESLYCMDPATFLQSGEDVQSAVEPCTENGVIGLSMNVDCGGVWAKTSDTVAAQEVITDNSYINGIRDSYCFGGTSMYMDGFHWLDSTCVIYLFPGWVLSTPGKLAGAAIGSIFFAMSLEGVIRGRRDIVQAMPVSWKRLGVSAGIYGLQLAMGYLIMLVVMTYSAPLFMSVIIGLMLGHVAFNAKDVCRANAAEATKDNCCKTDGDVSDDGTGEMAPCCSNEKPATNVPEGSTPCCQNQL